MELTLRFDAGHSCIGAFGGGSLPSSRGFFTHDDVFTEKGLRALLRRPASLRYGVQLAVFSHWLPVSAGVMNHPWMKGQIELQDML